MFPRALMAADGRADSITSLRTSSTSSLARTTLSQRFKKAIQQDNLELAQRIASRAFQLQMHRRPSAYKALQPPGLSSPNPPKAASRAAQAQRPPSSRPFDVRNVETVCEPYLNSKQQHRKYTLAMQEPSANDLGICSESSLICAIKSKAGIEMIEWLLEMGHEMQGPSLDAEGSTVLHLAAFYDRPDIIPVYCSSIAPLVNSLADLVDAETMVERRTALLIACIKGGEEVARHLIDLGANLDYQDRGGNTALHFAAAWGHLPLVHLLINRGCSFALQNNDKSTAADYAFSHSIKFALETFGRQRFESQKKARKPSMPILGSVGGSMHDVDMAHNGLRSKSFATQSVTDLMEKASDQNLALYSDWTPEKTFAQPGQNLLPGVRGTPSSPAVRLGIGNIHWNDPSGDLYGEQVHASPTSQGAYAGGGGGRLVAPLARIPGQSQAWHSPVPEIATPSPGGPHRQYMNNGLISNQGGLRRTPSPGLFDVGPSADKLRMQDAAAMSLFRSTTPQPAPVPGRMDTPPMPARTGSPYSMLSVRIERSPRLTSLALPSEA